MAIGVGIDVSKDKVDIASSDGRVSRSWPRTLEGMKQLGSELAGLDVHRVLLEASGGYEHLVLSALYAAGLPVVSVEPR